VREAFHFLLTSICVACSPILAQFFFSAEMPLFDFFRQGFQKVFMPFIDRIT